MLRYMLLSILILLLLIFSFSYTKTANKAFFTRVSYTQQKFLDSVRPPILIETRESRVFEKLITTTKLRHTDTEQNHEHLFRPQRNGDAKETVDKRG